MISYIYRYFFFSYSLPFTSFLTHLSNTVQFDRCGVLGDILFLLVLRQYAVD